jgi:ATP-dependent exoDNAse (exonuclease V) beta subunit
VSGARFSAEQATAIEQRQRSLALAANAGSGKTSVLVERFVRAVIEDGIAPGRLLAITFTERAAGELRGRVRRLLVDGGKREAAAEAATSFISTFHAFASRVLRAHPLLAGVAPDFVVLDDGQAAAIRERAFQVALEAWLSRAGALDLAATFGVDSLQSAIVAVYDECRSRGELVPRLPAARTGADLSAARGALAAAREAIAAELAGAPSTPTVVQSLDRLEHCRELLGSVARPAPSALAAVALLRRGKALETAAAEAYEDARVAFESALADQLAAAAVPLLDELLHEFGERFAGLKAAQGGVDFDDLELQALELLRSHPDVADAWSGRFERLMVDELQDTNARQMAILALLERDNLFTVGDEFQSIYSFRHADVAIFRERYARLGREQRALVLSANYRSRSGVIDSVNAVFAPCFGASFVPLRPGRADAAEGPPVELLLSDGEGWADQEQLLASGPAPAPLWRRAEAQLLAARIEELIGAGEARSGEIVVLTRAATAMNVYEAAIRDRGIATLTPAGEGFYERAEVADLAAYVQALANPFDELALYGVLASPLCGADSDCLVGLALAAKESRSTVWEALEESREPRLAAFARRFAQARLAASSRSLGAIVARAISDHGYELYLAQLASPERRIANVRKLVRLAREFERRDGRDLRRFADALSAGRLGGLREAEAPPPVADAVRLMTIHAAKGLEFPTVCLADLGHRPNTGQPRLLTDGERIGLRLPSIERKAHDTLDYAELLDERRAAQEAEERRIYYVAMTRARERLILSGAARFANWPSPDGCAIGWLAPALVPDLGKRLGSVGPAVDVVSGAGGVPVRLTLCDAASAEQLLAQPGRGVASPIAVPVAGASAPPAKTAGVGERLHSYTALADYERCGYRYYLQRVLSLPDIEAPGAAVASGIAAAPRGVLVHALLEQFDFAHPHPPAEAQITSAAAAAGITLAASDSAEIAALAGAVAASPLCQRLALARDVRREQPFAFALDGELIRGVLDVCAVEADGTLLIADYKTDRLREGEDLATHVERDYALQRLVYALAGLCSGAPRVEVAHCFLRAPRELLASAYPAAEREPLEAALRERLEPLRVGRFEVTALPGRERCGSCPGRARLCSYDESLTLADQPTPAASVAPGAR